MVKTGYRMPAEWHPHSATLLHWPSNRETWPGERLAAVESIYLELIEILHRYEPIVLLVSPGKTDYVEEILQLSRFERSEIHVLTYPVDDVWVRDCGPIFVETGEKAISDYVITDWEYNAWGGKYPPYDSDNKVPSFIARKFQIPHMQTGMVLEGGAIETNGKGVFLTTKSVLLNPNRNSNLDKTQIERKLHDYLGAEKIIWLSKGLAGDDTDGHIDDLARFIGERKILTTLPENQNDINYPVLFENLQILKEATDQEGNSFEIEVLPQPQTITHEATIDGSVHVPATYLNFYIANGVVLVPIYDEANDEAILNKFREYFPDRDICGISCSDLVWGQGSIHCITQQLYGL